MLKKSLLCLLLALALLAGIPAQAALYPEKRHLPVDYEDMLPVTPFDETALLSALEELEDLAGTKENEPARGRLRFLRDQILSELDVLATKVSLSCIQYDATGGGEEASALYLALSAQQSRLYDRCYQSFSKLAGSPYRDVLSDSAGEDMVQSFLNYKGMSEEDAALKDQEDRLVQEYDRIMSQGVPVALDGQTWTFDSLEDAWVDGETYDAVLTELWAAQDRAAGELFRQLVQIRDQIARNGGADNYTEYAYWVLYSRDYSPEDAAFLWEQAKTCILPLQLRVQDRLTEEELQKLDGFFPLSGEELLDGVQPFVEDFDEEMGDAFAFMREHHLYDIDYSPEKLPTGYTLSLPAYGSAFIFLCPYGDYRDCCSLVHEFGHFNETYHAVQHDLWSYFSIDVGEIHSQALELMFTDRAPDFFGREAGEVYTNAVLYNILDTILDGCLYDEFQAAAYQNPDLSVEELNRLFKQLSEEYGYYYDPGVEEDPSWVQNTHCFRYPLYFISYATSALSALDLWFLYLDQPQEARDIYLDLSALSLSLPYREAVERVGLRDIFAQDTIPELAEELETFLDGGTPVRKTGVPLGQTVMICVAVVWIGFCVVLMARYTRFLKRNYGWKYLRKAPKIPAESWPSRNSRVSGNDWAAGDDRDPWDQPPEKPPWEF